MGGVEAPPRVTVFWQQLPHAVLTDSVLRLAAGTNFLGDAKLGGALFVRDDYRGMLEELQVLIASGTDKVVVSGNPGIGKSWFGLFLLYALATSQPRVRVLWEASCKQRRYLFRGGDPVVLQGNLDAFAGALDDGETWCVCARGQLSGRNLCSPSQACRCGRYIVDEVDRGGPVDAVAKTVVLSSPTRSNYKRFLKFIGSTIRFMPVWSWEEIQACHAALYAHDASRPLAEVTAAFDRWDGMPRFVLEKLRDSAAQRMLDAAIATADLSALVNSVGEFDAAPETSNRVLHLATARPYVDTSVVFGSAYIAEAVLNKLQLLQREQLPASYPVVLASATSARQPLLSLRLPPTRSLSPGAAGR